KITDPVHVCWPLRLDGERRREDDESKRCDEPEGIEPHRALLLSTLGPQKPQGLMTPSLVRPNATPHLHREAVPSSAYQKRTALPGVRGRRLLGPRLGADPRLAFSGSRDV